VAGWLALSALLTALGCGGGDTTTLTVTQTDGSPLEPPAEDNHTLGVLSMPGSLDAVCRFIGVSSVSGAGSGDRRECSQVVDDCRGNVQAALGVADAPALPPTDLSLLLGCPLKLTELDACVAAALERGIDTYGSSVGCDMPALPAVDPIRLFASPDCIAVVLQCPELIASLAPQR
jgi:hypothetical protein